MSVKHKTWTLFFGVFVHPRSTKTYRDVFSFIGIECCEVVEKSYTPEFTNMTSWKILENPHFQEEIHGIFHCHVRFLGDSFQARKEFKFQPFNPTKIDGGKKKLENWPSTFLKNHTLNEEAHAIKKKNLAWWAQHVLIWAVKKKTCCDMNHVFFRCLRMRSKNQDWIIVNTWWSLQIKCNSEWW